MKYSLQELIDIPRLQALLDGLGKVLPVATAILDSPGNVLTASGSWTAPRR